MGDGILYKMVIFINNSIIAMLHSTIKETARHKSLSPSGIKLKLHLFDLL